MNRKLKWFYRISIWMISIFILSHILVKAIIWPSALEKVEDNYKYSIRIRKYIGDTRYTTEIKQRLFNAVDYLLTPAFTILFVVIAVKLVKTPEIFEEKE